MNREPASERLFTMCKCPVFSHFCCCCPLKVTNVISTVIIFRLHHNPMKVGALIIGWVYLVGGLLLGILYASLAVVFQPWYLEEMDDVVKLSDDQVQSLIFVWEHLRLMEPTNEYGK